jgi:Dienelactone hydrolase family
MGGADDGIPPSEVHAFDTAMTAAGVEHEIVIYPGASHGFFDIRHAEFTDACADAWRRTLAFIDREPAPRSPHHATVGLDERAVAADAAVGVRAAETAISSSPARGEG